MPRYSQRSKDRLATCHNHLQVLFNEVIKHFDCTILEGTRDKEAQDKYFKEGKTKVKYPNSKHNRFPSLAVDVAPYPVDWRNTARFYYFAGFVKGIAMQMGIKIRWGGDWDGDTEVRDQSFNDLPHFEVIL
jgi:peptidoglycan L-alanyl-D-glutamate endopeptidase CwlK